MNQTESPKKEAPVSNLLDLNAQPTSVQPQSSYVDTETNNRSYQTSVGQVGPTLQTQFSTSMQPISSFNFFDGPQASFKNIVTPFVEVLSESKTSREGKYNGVCIKGAFQR